MVDLSCAEAYASATPLRKLLYLVFLLCFRDKATELRFNPIHRGELPEAPDWSGSRIWYRVDGHDYEMVPAPLPFSDLADEVLNMRETAPGSLIRLVVNEEATDAEVSLQEANLVLRFLNPSPPSEEARRLLQRYVSRRPTKTRERFFKRAVTWLRRALVNRGVDAPPGHR